MLIGSKTFKNFFIQESPSGVVNGVNTSFTISHAPVFNAAFLLFQNGILLRQGIDYTISGVNVSMTTPPALGSILNSFYIRSL